MAITIPPTHRNREFLNKSKEVTEPIRENSTTAVTRPNPTLKSRLYALGLPSPHQFIDLLNGLRELIAYIDELLRGDYLLAAGHEQKDVQHLIRIADQLDKVLTVGATNRSFWATLEGSLCTRLFTGKLGFTGQ